MNKDLFIKELRKINIDLSIDKLEKLDKFYNLLIEWNEKINLTTIVNKEEVYLKHFYDSLTLIKVIDLNQDLKVLDVGTGAGFPGIVLKIVFPNLKVTLLDSLKKRINYFNEIIKELNLSDIETVCSRAEEYTLKTREKYDLVVARAVSHLRILSEISFASVKVNGYLIAMKSSVSLELDESLEIINKLGGEIVKIEEFQLPIENSKRTLIKIKKNKITDKKYPRNFSKIKDSHKKC